MATLSNTYGLDSSTLQRLQANANQQFTPQSTGFSGGGSGMFTNSTAGIDQAARAAKNNEAGLKAAMDSQVQGYAMQNGDKSLYTQAGGMVDPNDPWAFYRSGAGDKLAHLGGNPADFYENKLQQMSSGEFAPDDPSYQWRYDQGLQANERSLGARGLLNSGNAAIELQDYGQKQASTEYAAQFGRMLQGLSSVDQKYNNTYSRLAEMAGVNLNPSATDQLQVQQAGQFMNYATNNKQLDQAQGQWNDQLGMNDQYQQGLASKLNTYSRRL